MTMLLKKFFLCLKSDLRSFTTQIKSMENPVVALKDGKVRGVVKNLYDGSDYYSFKGIPYAQPPVGRLRFKDPLPPKPWEGILDAIEHGPVCPQTTPTREILGDENCLFLNVYTRSLKTDSNIPVMVYIHGGGFQYGSGNDDMYGPEFLLNHDVILVTFNYRLETFGFLCLDTPEVPGNAGMKDQVLALRWVQKNIKKFGGDPENVTLFGESAGGASVTYHMLSDMSKGLFNKAISQSGVCLNDWAFDDDARTRAFRVGKLLGKETNDTQELLEFLQSVPSNDLIAMNFKVASKDEKHRGLPIRFRPVVERKFANKEAFITDKPLDLLLAGKFNRIPFIIGYNSREGFIMAQTELKKVDFTNKFPSFLVLGEIARRVSEEKLKEYGDRIKKFYCGNRDIDSDDVDIVSDMQTDMHFSVGIYRMANIYSSLCKATYMYRFDLCTELNIFKAMMGLSAYKGVSHADELFYVFKNSFNADIYEEKEKIREYVYMITKIWTDFVKTGNPTPDGSLNLKWLPYTSTTKQYLSIDEKWEMGKNAERERLEFWMRLYNEVGLPCDTKSNL